MTLAGGTSRFNHALSITSIVLSSMASAVTIGVVGSGRDCSAEEGGRSAGDYVVLMLAVGGLIGSTLMSVHKLLGPAELQREHDFYSDMYEQLRKEIDMQLMLEAPSDGKQCTRACVFVSLHEFVKHCKNRMDILVDKAPSIPSGVQRRFKRMMDAGLERPSSDIGDELA
jgi:hypothetical protein